MLYPSTQIIVHQSLVRQSLKCQKNFDACFLLSYFSPEAVDSHPKVFSNIEERKEKKAGRREVRR
jgi:hypothetical protein